MPDENAQVTNIRKRLGFENPSAILGDNNTPANIWDNTKPGNVWIRYLTGNGYSTPVSVRGPAGKSVKLNAGTKVKIGYDDDMQLAVLGIDFAGAVASGINPVVSNNGAQPTNNGFVGQDQISTLVCHSTNSLSIAVRGWKPIVSGMMYDFPGSSIDLASYIPASTDNHRVVVIFLKSDYITLEAFGSTEKGQGIPLDTDDINEALALATAGSTPIWAYRLYYGQTSVLDSDTFLDCRQLVNVGNGGSAYYQTIQGNNTPVTQRSALDFVDSGSVTWSVTDDSANNRTQISATATGSGGSITDIYSNTLSSDGTWDVSGLSLSTYIKIEIAILSKANTGNQEQVLRLFLNNDTTSSNYYFVERQAYSDGYTNNNYNGNDSRVGNVPGSGGEFSSATITILQPGGSQKKQALRVSGHLRADGKYAHIEGLTYWNNTSAITRIAASPDSGSFASGSQIYIRGYQ